MLGLGEGGLGRKWDHYKHMPICVTTRGREPLSWICPDKQANPVGKNRGKTKCYEATKTRRWRLDRPSRRLLCWGEMLPLDQCLIQKSGFQNISHPRHFFEKAKRVMLMEKVSSQCIKSAKPKIASLALSRLGKTLTATRRVNQRNARPKHRTYRRRNNVAPKIAVGGRLRHPIGPGSPVVCLRGCFWRIVSFVRWIGYHSGNMRWNSSWSEDDDRHP